MPLLIRLNFFFATIKDIIYFGPVSKPEGVTGVNVFKKETTASLSTGCLLKLTNGISNSVDYFNKNEKKSFYYNVQPGLHVGVKKSKLLFYSSALITNFKIEFHTLSEFLTFFEKITDEILYGSKIIGIRQCLTFRQCISHLAQLDDWGKEVLDNWNFMTIYQCLPDLQVLPSTCLLYTSPSPRDGLLSRMPSSA